MRLGIYIKWPIRDVRSRGNVLGDELHAEAMRKAIRNHPAGNECEVYAPNFLPAGKMDVMIYLNDTEPNPEWAKKHVLYMQNAYGEGSDKALLKFHRMNFNGYAFLSRKLLRFHEELGYSGILLPFGVDIDLFYPREPDPRYSHEVSYVGNDIKGEHRTLMYLFPAVHFRFGLYGTWLLHRLRYWKNLPYQKKFARISRGKIPQEEIPVLYSSSKINLNCTAQDCVDWDVITLRTFEVLACKGFLVTDRVPEAENALQNCVVFTDGGDDLRDKIAHFLKRPEERARIAGNGYEYVRNNATMESRMNTLLEYLEAIP